MIRTQVLLNEQLKKELVSYSRLYDKSVSQVIRESVRAFLNRPKAKKQVGIAWLQKLSEMKITGGPKDLSERVDEILYK